jgi:hypothetical protein
MFSIHLPTLDRPEGGKAWKLLRATMAEGLSRLSARPFFPGGTLPSGPLMPALPLCTAASIIRREWVAFLHIMPCLLVLVASWRPQSARDDLLLISNSGVTCGPDPMKERLDLIEHLTSRP